MEEVRQMKKAYVTGITGTVAPYVKEELLNNGYQVFDKHIRVNEVSDISKSIDYIKEINPDIILHLALGTPEWAEELAKYCFNKDITFVYISTVSVFDENGGGPYTKNTPVLVENDYGKYKYNCEKLVKAVNPNTYIIRIGWQISDKGDVNSNNMFNFIKKHLDHYGFINVSDCHLPSVSFLDDTAKGIRYVIENKTPDLYLLNSNDGLSLYDIICGLKAHFKTDWKIESNSDFCRNDIMIDDRVQVRKLNDIFGQTQQGE